MALSKLTENLNYVSSLANQPTETAEELKRVFDKAGNTLKDYINNRLIEEIEYYYMPYTGGTFKGNIYTQSVMPAQNEVYDLGSSVGAYKHVYANALVQKVPVKAGSAEQVSHSYGFAWDGNAIRVAIDGDVNNKFLMHSDEHAIILSWNGTKVELWVDGTFVGYLLLERS